MSRSTLTAVLLVSIVLLLPGCGLVSDGGGSDSSGARGSATTGIQCTYAGEACSTSWDYCMNTFEDGDTRAWVVDADDTVQMTCACGIPTPQNGECTMAMAESCLSELVQRDQGCNSQFETCMCDRF